MSSVLFHGRALAFAVLCVLSAGIGFLAVSTLLSLGGVQ